jgi:hypothetical protein
LLIASENELSLLVKLTFFKGKLVENDCAKGSYKYN